MVKRNTLVDGIKGLTILIVIIHHFVLAFCPTIMDGRMWNALIVNGGPQFFFASFFSVFYNGLFAVSLFFVITGYLLSKQVKHHEEDKDYVPRAIASRFFRLIPIIAPVLLVGYILMSLNLTFNTPVGIYTKSNWFLSFFPLGKVSLWMIVEDLFTRIPFVTGAWYYNVLWMIPLELYGSWFTYIFASLFQNSKLKTFMYVMLCVALFKTNFIQFLFGIMLADYEEKIKVNKFTLFVCFALSLFLGSLALSSLQIPNIGIYSTQFKAVAALLFMFSILKSKILTASIDHRVFVYFGQRSYYYYLMHSMSLITVCSYTFLAIKSYMSFTQAMGVAFVVYFVGTVILSEILKLYEDRFHYMPQILKKNS